MGIFGFDDTDVQILGILIGTIAIPMVPITAFLIKVARTLDVLEASYKTLLEVVKEHNHDSEVDQRTLQKCVTNIVMILTRLDYLEGRKPSRSAIKEWKFEREENGDNNKNE